MTPRTKKANAPTSESAPPHTMPSHEMSAPEVVRVWLLGGFRVSVGSRTIGEDGWRLRKAASLLKLLALAPGHRLHRERAMDLLWPDLGLGAASNNLRQALHVARRTLHPDPAVASRYLSLRGEQLALCPEGRLWVDVDAFEETARAARREREPAAYQAALALYAGELLPEDRYEEWAEEHRRRLRQTYLSLLIGLAGLYEQRGEHEPGLEVLRRTVAEEPANEEAHVALMHLYASSGRSGEALRQYVRLSEALSSRLEAEPSASTRALREEIAAGRFPGGPTQPAGLPTEETAGGGVGKHSLPAPRDGFVGWEHEMLEVKRDLAMTRLLTLTGAGGSGKTRLALEVARDLVRVYPDGVWLVELAPLSEGALVPQVVSGALGVSEQKGRAPIETLVEALREKELLLVLDNCEHLVDAAARLVDALLDSCARLRILATSREALGVAGEINRPVPTLSLPDAGRSQTVVELERCESARLFVERARRRNPAFALTEQNASAVAEICLRLDGIPLAIELAAARVGLSAGQIAAKLNDLLRLLTTGNRTATPRHQTLEGALDWSRELLSESERTLFERLSVFAGGWTLEGAEAVGSGDGIEPREVLDLLSGLVDKSLVVAEATGSVEVRYRMLEPVRQYARERLEDSGEAETLKRAHAEYFLALAEKAEPKLTTAEQGAWLKRLGTEHDNLRAALSWSLGRKDAELALRLGGALWRFWFVRGYVSEGLRWLEEVLTLGGGVTALRAKVLNGAGDLVWSRGNYGRAKELYEESLALSRQLGDKRGIATALENLGSVARNWGDYATGRSLFEKALPLRRELGDKWGLAESLFLSGAAATFQGDYAAARPPLEEALALYRETGEQRGIGEALGVLGLLTTSQGDYGAASHLIEEAKAVMKRLGYRRGLAKTLSAHGDLALEQRDYELAYALYEEALTIFADFADKWWIAWCLEGIGAMAAAQDQPVRAVRIFAAAKVVRDAMDTPGMAGHRAIYERHLATARAQLDEAAWEKAFAEGKVMGLEEAVDHALSEEERATHAPERPSDDEVPAALTRREGEVAAMVAQGLTNRQIASDLHLSERTVENHVSKILRKLELASRAQITAWATQQRLLVPEPD